MRREALAAGTRALAASSFLRWGWGADPGASAPERARRCGCGEPGPGVGVRHPERGNGLKSRGAVLPSLGTRKFTLLAPTFRGLRQTLERGSAPLHQKSPPLLEHSSRREGRGPGRDCAVGVLAPDPILCHILPWSLASAPACLCSERGLNSPSKVKIPPPRDSSRPPPSRSPGTLHPVVRERPGVLWLGFAGCWPLFPSGGRAHRG